MRDTVERELIGSSKVLLEHGLDVARREAAQERADHKRLQRPGARHVLAQHPALEAELGRVAHAWTLQLDGAAGGAHPAPLVAVAVRHRLLGALVAGATEELAHLVLQRLLQDQPRSQATDRLHRILLLADTGQRLIELCAKPIARGYSRHAGVPPFASTGRSKRRLRPPLQFPRTSGRHLDKFIRADAFRPRSAVLIGAGLDFCLVLLIPLRKKRMLCRWRYPHPALAGPAPRRRSRALGAPKYRRGWREPPPISP